MSSDHDFFMFLLISDRASTQVLSYLPYPTHDQGMPVPYGEQPLAPYPNYIPPPLPTTFNPYATMPFSVQGNFFYLSLII